MTESLSEYAKIPLGQEVESFDVSPQFNGYSGIEIPKDDGTSSLVGNRTGRVIAIPGITKTQAQNILAELQSTAFQYQPHETQGALLNPAAELGDGVTINGTYSGIYKMNKQFSPLMQADISAPQDEELDHEYPFEPKQDRVYQRAIAENKSQISLTQEQIQSEVTRATNSENNLRSSITQTATNINAEVSKKVTANTGQTSRETFGWNLTSTSWRLYSGGTTVFKATEDGVEVTGKITASSGKIGGFSIGSSAIYKGTSSLTSTTAGVYVGTNGIRVYGSNGSFTADNQGNVKLTGTLTIGSSTINANQLRSGAASAYGWANTKDSSGTTQAGRWSTGSGYGYNYHSATGQNTSSYPSYFSCGTLTVWNGIVSKGSFSNGLDTTIDSTGFYIDGKRATWKEKTVVTGVTATGTYPVYTTTGSIVYPPTSINASTTVIYYLGR